MMWPIRPKLSQAGSTSGARGRVGQDGPRQGRMAQSDG